MTNSIAGKPLDWFVPHVSPEAPDSDRSGHEGPANPYRLARVAPDSSRDYITFVDGVVHVRCTRNLADLFGCEDLGEFKSRFNVRTVEVVDPSGVIPPFRCDVAPLAELLDAAGKSGHAYRVLKVVETFAEDVRRSTPPDPTPPNEDGLSGRKATAALADRLSLVTLRTLAGLADAAAESHCRQASRLSAPTGGPAFRPECANA